MSFRNKTKTEQAEEAMDVLIALGVGVVFFVIFWVGLILSTPIR